MAEVDIVRVLRLRAEDENCTQDDAALMIRAAARIEVLEDTPRRLCALTRLSIPAFPQTENTHVAI